MGPVVLDHGVSTEAQHGRVRSEAKLPAPHTTTRRKNGKKC